MRPRLNIQHCYPQAGLNPCLLFCPFRPLKNGLVSGIVELAYGKFAEDAGPERGNAGKGGILGPTLESIMIQTSMKNKRGFTLIEVMIVVAIIALIAAMAIPNYLGARRRVNAIAAVNSILQASRMAETIWMAEGQIKAVNLSAYGVKSL